jgi:hypothetical protein
MRKGVKILDKIPKRSDSYLSFVPMANPVDLFDILDPPLPDLFQKKRKPDLPFS